MVNKKGGKKHKKGKKSSFQEKKELRFKEEGQEYALIKRCKGNCRFDVLCTDGKERMAILCGSMRKRRFVNMDQIVLVSIRDFEDSKCDIIDLYDDNETYKLIEYKEVPSNFSIQEDNEFSDNLNGDDDYFSHNISDDDNINEENIDEEDDSDEIDMDDI